MNSGVRRATADAKVGQLGLFKLELPLQGEPRTEAEAESEPQSESEPPPPAEPVLLAGSEPQKKRGGKRRGAGRPAKGERASERHKERPFHHARHPVHVVLRAVKAVNGLRRRRTYQAMRQATRTTARRTDFRIVHLSVQRTHIHLLVEAKDKAALASGMQGFQISAAKHLNAAISQGRPGPRRRGSVFPDRYHAVVIASPRQARHALSYVVNNWRKHAEDQNDVTRRWDVDWYSSGPTFLGWKECGRDGFARGRPPGFEPMEVATPKTWLLQKGWKLHGAISCREVPSAAR